MSADLGPCIDHGRIGGKQGYLRQSNVVSRGLPALAHRRVFLEHHGWLPPVVMHICDNPRCVNINHLQAGDWAANNKDRANKGRSAKSVHSRRKITQEQAEQIRTRFAKRKPKYDLVNGVSAIARDYNVDPNVVYNIAQGKTHVY